MNFRNNKGYTGTDLVVSILIIMIFIPTIVSLIAVISTSGGETEKKAYAISVASNVLEIAKSCDIEKLSSNSNKIEISEDDDNEFCDKLKNEYNADITVENECLKWSLEDKSNNQYEVLAYVEDYKYMNMELNQTISENVVKKITVTVNYRVNNNTKSIEMSTLKTKE